MDDETKLFRPDGSTENPSQQAASSSAANDIQNSSFRQQGAQLGEFRLLRRLGKGGMAEVWLAEQITLRRNVAVKLLRPELMEDGTYVQRFQTEAKAAAGLNHPNIVQVYTVGCEQGQHYIAQEYVQGQTLKAFLQKRGPLDLSVALILLRQVASALQAASERGIVHRDIKPENIMLTRKGEAKVADFGLAQLQGGERLNLTQEGVTMGTPLYMSPEQVQGQSLDQRSDLYSLGVTFYHALAGKPPFHGDNAVSVAVKHLHEKPMKLSDIRPDLPMAICDLIHKMMAREPENRYQTAQAVVNDVRKLAKAVRTGENLETLTISDEDRPISFPTRRPALVLGLLCLTVFALSAGMGWLLRPGIPAQNPNALDESVPRLNSARDQYLYAMIEVDNEDAFRAVIKWFDDPKDRIWTQRAHEQLAFLYLKDRRRHRDAERELAEIKSLDPTDKRLQAESRIGQAYLHALNGNAELAQRILQSDAVEFDEYLTGSWRELELDVRRLINRTSSPAT
ncbi:MAG: serine/threonine protein kinase [Planctomycetaceae bacterium]|nr:serine/threonine protein kinase [Planctomycetaceae bacterium]